MVRKQPDRNVLKWLAKVDQDNLFLSVITIGEIEKGVAKLAESARKKKISEWLHDDLIFDFRSTFYQLIQK
jgi:predicted nucleic acid-binding protein